MTTICLCRGMYKCTLSDGRVFIIENVSKDVGCTQWNISEQTNTNKILYRHPPCDAAASLKEAKELIKGWE